MYANESKMFGLHEGQMTSPDLVHNGGWYNKLGEKIGWGDLCPANMAIISAEIPGDELFIILSEQNSFWKFVKRPGAIGLLSEVDSLKEYKPGIEYVLEKCKIIIKTSEVLVVYTYGDKPPKEPYDGRVTNCKWISRSEAKKIIDEYAKK